MAPEECSLKDLQRYEGGRAPVKMASLDLMFSPGENVFFFKEFAP